MVPFTLVLSLFCLLFGSHVLAGSSIWQPALISRSNSSMLDKRYYYVTRDQSLTSQRPWPNRVIRYCFDKETTAAQKSTLKKFLKDARKIWISKGLDSNFRIEEVNDNVCTSEATEVLTVHHREGVLATTVGFPSSTIGGVGPQMFLSDSTEIGMLDVVGNFAHELGHAWGLYHEHQNPKFWAGVAGADGGEVFGPNNPGGWNCDNLKDYYTAANGGLRLQTGGGGFRDITIQQLCSNWQIAKNNGFSASEYLPMTGVGTPHSNGHGENDVDWQSIMIYPSGAGGNSNGQPTPQNDNRDAILMKPDGSRIPINLAPSSLDIAALNAMYANVEGTKLDLFNSLTNFKKVYKTSQSGPSGGSGCL
ncbi:hypothetical protein GQ607_005013 [Colletotrichum asianum]|uniref:Metalloprotease n=1 Tax=Colletotrichum asianum TaxID=702518 RepID=A0A8H3ZPN7_9PEZI|nr:hypothetical protein GQ607_005013 [Colletotrichum asianum]